MPSVPAEQFSTSVLAEQLRAIELPPELSVKKNYVLYMGRPANDNFHGDASTPEPPWLIPTPLLVFTLYAIHAFVVKQHATAARLPIQLHP